MRRRAPHPEAPPGSITDKAVAFDHLEPLTNPGAVIFGSTILDGGMSKSWAARRLVQFYNEKGIFSNAADHLEGLEKALRDRFEDVSIEVIGCAALFSGHRC